MLRVELFRVPFRFTAPFHCSLSEIDVRDDNIIHNMFPFPMSLMYCDVSGVPIDES